MKYIKSLAYTFSIILVSNIIFTLLNYFNLLNGNLFKIITCIYTLIAIFFGSFILGMHTNEKGYKNGITFGLIIVLIFLVFKFIFKVKFNLILIISYMIIIIVSMVGSMIGINRKKA